MLKRNVALVFCALWVVACSSGSVKGSVQLEGAPDSSGIAVTLNGGDKPVTLVTQADGAFAFDPVSDGMYSLVMESSDIADGRWVMAVQLKEGKPVEVPPVKLTLVGTVRGRVNVEGSIDGSGVQVAVAGTDRLVLTGPDGAFTLKGVPAGAQKLVAVREGFQPAILDLSVVRGEQESPAIELKRGNMAAVVEGNVGYYTGANPNTITVKARGTNFSATADDSGRYTLKLPAGAYTLVAEAPQYPAQIIGQVTVAAGAVTQAPVAVLSIYRKLPAVAESREGATLQLLNDKKHALLMRYTDLGSVASLYDLESDRERIFFAVTEESLDTDDFVVSDTGRGVAYWEYNGYVVFDTQTGASYVLRTSDVVVRSSMWFGSSSGAFSKDGLFFFFNDGEDVVRLSLASGQITTFPASNNGEQVDADHYFVFDRGTTEGSEFGATLVTPSTATLVLSKMNGVYGLYGKYLVALTDCDDTNCKLKMVNGTTGEVKTVNGSYPPGGTSFDTTNHDNWVIVSADKYYFLSLSQATATALPDTLSPYSLDINSNGTRAVFSTYDSETSHYKLHVAPMPPTSIPTATAESTNSFDYGWLSATRMFAFDYASPYTAIDMNTANDTKTIVTGIEGNQWIRGNMVSWKRESDNALMGASGDGAPFVLNTNAKDAAYVDYQEMTRNGAWSVWAVYEKSDYTLIARDNATGTQRTYKSVYPYDPRLTREHTLGSSPEYPIGSETVLFVRRNYGDGAYELLDLPSGTRRLAIEPGVAGISNAGFTEDGTFWISAYYYADPVNYVMAPAIAIF